MSRPLGSISPEIMERSVEPKDHPAVRVATALLGCVTALFVASLVLVGVLILVGGDPATPQVVPRSLPTNQPHRYRTSGMSNSSNPPGNRTGVSALAQPKWKPYAGQFSIKPGPKTQTFVP